MPTPGPSEYNTDAKKPHTPAYSMRLKLDPKQAIDDNPGPGHYDIDDSTIGNWGAGMAAHQPIAPGLSLPERIEAFARSVEYPGEHKDFFRANRTRLGTLRRLEEGKLVTAPRPPRPGASAAVARPATAFRSQQQPLFYDS
jgi:Sperm-tail PG-rich repeat